MTLLDVKKLKRQSLNSLYVTKGIVSRRGTPEQLAQVEEIIAKKEGRG